MGKKYGSSSGPYWIAPAYPAERFVDASSRANKVCDKVVQHSSARLVLFEQQRLNFTQETNIHKWPKAVRLTSISLSIVDFTRRHTGRLFRFRVGLLAGGQQFGRIDRDRLLDQSSRVVLVVVVVAERRVTAGRQVRLRTRSRRHVFSESILCVEGSLDGER